MPFFCGKIMGKSIQFITFAAQFPVRLNKCIASAIPPAGCNRNRLFNLCQRLKPTRAPKNALKLLEQVKLPSKKHSKDTSLPKNQKSASVLFVRKDWLEQPTKILC